MRLVLSQKDIEEKLKALLRMEGLSVTNLTWDMTDPPQVSMEFAPAETPKAALTPHELFAKMDKEAIKQWAELLRNETDLDKPKKPRVRRTRKKKEAATPAPSADGLDDPKQVMRELNSSLATEHPITGKKGTRRLGPSEFLEYPADD